MLIFRDERYTETLKPTCETVLAQYDLPEKSLVCIFDDQERPGFLNHPPLGLNFCGFFLPVAQSGIGHGVWAQELIAHIWDNAHTCFSCDAVIYIRKRTCDTRIGTAITFAHELQHFMQYGHHRDAWRLQHGIQSVCSPKMQDPRPWHFPGEHEAQLCSKKVAEQIFGKQRIREYAQERIDCGDDVEKWRFFMEIDPTSDFDFRLRTEEWVSQCKQDLNLYFPGLIK